MLLEKLRHDVVGQHREYGSRESGFENWVWHWVQENVIENIENVPEIDLRELRDDDEDTDTGYVCRVAKEKKTGKWTDCETEDLNFENMTLIDFDWNTDTIIMSANGDWQDEFKLSVQFRPDDGDIGELSTGSWVCFGDVKKIKESDDGMSPKLMTKLKAAGLYDDYLRN